MYTITQNKKLLYTQHNSFRIIFFNTKVVLQQVILDLSVSKHFCNIKKIAPQIHSIKQKATEKINIKTSTSINNQYSFYIYIRQHLNILNVLFSKMLSLENTNINLQKK